MQEHLLRYDKTKKLLFCDTETLNLCLNFCNNLPWQISAIEVLGETIQKEHDYYLKWDTKLQCSPGAAAINHHNPFVIAERGVSPQEAFDKLFPLIEGCDYLVGHNLLGFDIPLIYELYRHFGKNPSHLVKKVIDTNLIAKGIKCGVPFNPATDNFIEYQYRFYHLRKKGIRTNMKVLATEYEIEFDEKLLHNSAYDLKINIAVWNKLKWQVEI